MKLLYIDCISGVAGDMLLGALLDAGVPLTAVTEPLEALGLQGWTLTTGRVRRAGLAATKADVEVAPGRPARRYADIRALLEEAPLPGDVSRRALQVFRLLGEAEAKVHGVALDEVHFHEVGALDAIVDVVGCCAALSYLAPERVECSPLPTGGGTVETAHGRLPVPAPAVLELLRGAPLVPRGETELVTPTGAALVAAFADGFGPMPAMTLEATGYGAGERDLDEPNVVRVLVGSAAAEARDAPLLLETNIDDMNIEQIPYVVEALLGAGALDAWTTPIVMKKGRPAVTLAALVTPEGRERALDVLFAETTTFGVRETPVARTTLQREWVEVAVEGHPVRVKIGRRAGRVLTVAPEHDDATAVARATGMPLREVYGRAEEAARTLL